MSAVGGVAYRAIAQVVLVDLLRRRPDEAVGGKVGAEALQRLPCLQDGAVGGLVEIAPEEGGLVARDLRRGHQPLGHFIEIQARDGRVGERRDEVDMGNLHGRQYSGCSIRKLP